MIWNVSCFPPSSNPGPGPQFEAIEILGMNQILQDQTRIFKKKEKFHYPGPDHDDHESDAYQDNGDDDEKDKDQMLAAKIMIMIIVTMMIMMKKRTSTK